ncbi:immobilization antigen isoform, putative [Ichthyophthirius multifiliis]|uniref:Immobilization antigen isoform, putative n=1 Tax=Ichthyophthirius multifiliis TaxID=5932 RepID=G0R4B3_ICHMU|nr:immobilization antigen isoform, putative [Ichthyophthirius multifiliis]EGR27693.1 immobilization antigen isoform, putative [Ichthyophthirius multifiliis]|eukprot:XP_004025145.1 immobilization antigen isoform, putative [Ichthyophthirius multifiliis]
MYKYFLITLVRSLFINELIAIKCNIGTETNIAGDDDNRGDIANCVNCRANYYYNGDNFIPGVSQCEKCPISKKVGARPNAGGNARLVLQCDINCPTGTQTEQGNTTYVAQREEYNFCKVNHYYQTKGLFFQPGVDSCNKCSVQKTSDSEATLGRNASLAKQCDVSCPTGTSTKTGSTSYVSYKYECVNCKANFYYNSFGFQPGESSCEPCQNKKKIGAKETEGLNAKIDIQCDAECPTGTVVYDGDATYKSDKSDCVKCAPYYYTTKQKDWVAGIDACIPCPKIENKGSKANYPQFATQSTQCNGAFSQFFTFSLLFIYLYILL